MIDRIDEEYITNQLNGLRNVATHRDHKVAIAAYDMLYSGDLSALFPGEDLGELPLVENSIKNATHDIERLATEAKGSPVFMRKGDTKADLTATGVRTGIANTLWEMGGGPEFEPYLYLDMAVAGYAAVAVYVDKEESDYPRYMRLDPRNCYPDVVNGQLLNMLYTETMKERFAAELFDVPWLDDDPSKNMDVMVSMYFDKYQVVQSVSKTNAAGEAVATREVGKRWIHGLDCVPVAWEKLPTADGRFHGYFDQLGGPLMARNKTVKLLIEYLESMARAPFEAKGILNPNEEPGIDTVYQHDPNAEFNTFMRRVAPATPSGSVFGLLQYLDAQEATEGNQPPARVGIVSQSIASGSFVASTQGSLSSVVKELQDRMALLRKKLNHISFDVDKKWLNKEKPLFQAVGKKVMYTPDDMGDWYQHTIQYGAAAGLNRSEADNRIAMHLTQRLIDKTTARQQLDYLDDVSTVQDSIDAENLADAFFQRFAADPNTPQSLMAKCLILMSKGKSFIEALEVIEPELFAAEQAAQQAAAPAMPAGPGVPPGAQTSDTGGAGGGGAIQPALPIAPTNQVVTRNPVF
jgi:hypothetical protein